MYGNGFIYPKIPEMEIREILKLEEKNKIGETILEIETEESLQDLQEYSQSWVESCKGKTLLFYNQQFQVKP